jgi:hypothetical protein
MRIARLKIHVDPAPGAPGPVLVMVDGVALPPALLDADRLTDPGGHHVSARQGTLAADTDVQLGDGQALAVSLALGAGPGASDRGAASPTAGFGPAQPMAPSQAYPAQGGYPAAAGAPPSAWGPEQSPSSGPEASPPPVNEFTGLALGVRIGVGLPLGSLSGAANDGLSNIISAEVPIWFDAGYRFTPNWYLGAYFMYGFGFLGSAATDPNGDFAAALGSPCGQQSVGCSIHDMRAGIDAAYHLLPGGRVDPWLGLGIGHEWLDGNISFVDPVTNLNQSFGVGYRGWEFVNVQVGLDIKKILPNLGIGPYAALTVSEYTTAEEPARNQPMGLITSSSVSVQNTSLHEWLMFGVRGEYDIQL